MLSSFVEGGRWRSLPRNILTGIFVDSALQNGQEEKRRFLLQEVGELFLEADKVTHEQKFRKFRVPSSVGPSPGFLLIESNRDIWDMYDSSFSITSLSLVQSCKVLVGLTRSRWPGWISKLSWKIRICSNCLRPWMWMKLGKHWDIALAEATNT